jgi:hypothetical protein
MRASATTANGWDERGFVPVVELEIGPDIRVVHGDHAWRGFERRESLGQQGNQVSDTRSGGQWRFQFTGTGGLAVRGK